MTNSQRKRIANAFGLDLDPLLELEQTFVENQLKPFEAALDNILSDHAPKSTVDNYEIPIEQWKVFMARKGRHPACPNEAHVEAFAENYLTGERGNSDATIKQKLKHLNRVYEEWVSDAAFPHFESFNPFKQVIENSDFETSDANPPRITVPELSEVLNGITHWRDLLIIVAMLKLGLRASELCNVKISEMNIQHQGVNEYYDELGSHKRVADRPNSVFIPADRTLNKSDRPRILPLDDELRDVLIEYLLIRPDNGKPWLLLSPTRHNQMDNSKINEIWKEHFHPEYQFPEGHEYDSVTSHYGRHKFTSHLDLECGWKRERVAYMTGHGGEFDESTALTKYLHTYYEDIREPYLEQVYKFNLL